MWNGGVKKVFNSISNADVKQLSEKLFKMVQEKGK